MTPITLAEINALLAPFSEDERYLCLERLGHLYEDKPVTREQVIEVIRAEI